MGWGRFVGVFFLIREVRGETDEGEARKWCKGSDGMQSPRLQAEPTVPYHLVMRLGKGARCRQKTDFCAALLLRAQPQGVVDLGYARVRGGRKRRESCTGGWTGDRCIQAEFRVAASRL